MKTISLKCGRVAIVDDVDFDRVQSYGWYFSGRYVMARSNMKIIYLHKVILNAPKGQQVDHANRDTLDNRRSNLRFCTGSQNSANSSSRRGVSGFRGVFRSPKNKLNPWTTCIQVQNRRMFIGAFGTADAAAKAYDQKAKEHFGPFAMLNFPT